MFRLAWGDVGQRTIPYVDTKRRRTRFTPLLAPVSDDLGEWFLASGRPDARAPVFPAHDGAFWDRDDWANWRRLVWKGEPERSSYITVRIYEGVPLTTVAKEVGTSIAMLEQHYAGVISDWDGRQVPAERQVRQARATGARSLHARKSRDGTA
jgi:hypothetical protein